MDNRMRQGHISIQSTELFFLENEIADIGSRTLAYCWDLLIKIAAGTLIVLPLALAHAMRFSTVKWAVLTVEFLIITCYHFFFEAFFAGKTPGKRLVGIRVLRSDGSRLSVLDAAVRNVLRLVDMFPLGYLLAMCVMFFEKYNRRIGDLVADTVVIYDRARYKNLNAFLATNLLEAKPRSAITIRNIELLTTPEKEIVKELYSRMTAMSEDEKIKILAKFWEKYSQKLRISGTDDPEVFLYELYKRI
jgi:uncharacterized RDD family membrane protein YckC